MTEPSWLDDEKAVVEHVRQAAELVSCGVRRPLVFGACAVLLTALVVAVAVLSKRSYAPTLVLRVSEPASASAGAPTPPRELSEYVRRGIFTSAPLLAIAERHGLYPSLVRKNPRSALESFREDIDVVARDNYFLESRGPGRAPRSARLSISYRGSNAEVALAVTQELGALVVEHEAVRRRDESERALVRASREVDAADRAVVARRAAILAHGAAPASSSSADLARQVELVGLLGSLPALELRRDASTRRASALSLGAALEARGLGLQFDVVDDGEESSRAGRPDLRLYLASLSLVLGLPLMAMAVGAFDSKRGRS